MKWPLFKLSIMVIIMLSQTAYATAYSCTNILSKKEEKLMILSEEYVKKSVLPILPHGENIYEELKNAKQTGVIACIAIEFTIDNSLKVKAPRILNEKYNRSIARNSLEALNKYEFKENSKNKNAIVIIQFDIEK